MLYASISDLQNTNKISIPGVCMAYAIAKDMISTMPGLLDIMQSTNPNAASYDSTLIYIEASFMGGGPLLTMSNSAVNKISLDNESGTNFTENEKPSVHNPFFTYEVTFNLPNDDEVLRGQILRAFDNREWIVIVRESGGPWRILGNLNRGCDFKAALATGSQTRGQSIYKCGFYWESSERALYMIAPALTH